MEDSLYALEFEMYVKEKENNSQANKNTRQTPNKNTPSTHQYHKVRSGETLGTIASRYGTTVAEIQRINGLRSTKIYVGQRLKVKKGKTTRNTKPRNTVKKYYTVRSGDTFGRIAQRHRMTQSQLKRLNSRINISRLSIGQKIRIK
jgi:LysM repeat protein